MNPVLKWVLISFGSLLGVMIVAAIIVPLFIPFGGTGAPVPRGEFETVQTAIQALMVFADVVVLDVANPTLPSLKLRTNTKLLTAAGSGEDVDLTDYMDQDTRYCYLWEPSGRVTAQYDVDVDGNCTTTKIKP